MANVQVGAGELRILRRVMTDQQDGAPDAMPGLITWLSGAGACPSNVLLIATEPHVWDRVGSTATAGVLDLSDYLSTTPRGRRRAIRKSLELLDSCLSERAGVNAVVFDSSEGWLSTSLFWGLRRRQPSLVVCALQHGVMAYKPILDRAYVRAMRMWGARLTTAVLGFSPIGSGFGNLPVDLYCALGDQYAARYTSVCKSTTTVVNPRFVLGVDMPVPIADEQRRRIDVLFLHQDMTIVGVEWQQAQERCIAALRDVCSSRSAILRVRPHPKGRVDCAETVARVGVETDIDVDLPTALACHPVVVSCFSTGLLQAELLGCRALAVRPPGDNGVRYRDFTEVVPEESIGTVVGKLLGDVAR